jgi:hypothetical protein
MHHIHDSFDVIDRGVLQDAMTEIEDMTRSSFGAAKNIQDARLDLRQRGE